MKKILYFLVLATMLLQTGFLSGIPALAQGEVTETPTPTLEPTNTPEPTATASPTASPTPSATETPIPSETPTAAPVVEVKEVLLTLSTNPTYIKRGGELYVDWSIEGLAEIAKGMILRFYLPEGITVIDPKIGILNKAGDTLDVEVTELKGRIGFNVGENVVSPLTITAELLQEEKGLAKAEISLLDPDETLVESGGGSAEGLKGKVRVNFPAGALSETVKVTIGKPSKESLPVQSLSGAPFEITAVSESTKAEVSEFAQPVEIQVEYSEAGMADESDVRLYWYDPADGQWKLPLRQHVDKENNLIIAYTDHFTAFDMYNANWQTALTPTLSGFQTSQFTGAASFALPIKVPAGPGGFQPSLTLSYSSSVVDNVGMQSQASWVGMGWSLTTSYIERVGHGTNGVQDDTYSLNLNGMSVELLPGADGKYHASDENFYKSELSGSGTNSTWTIWDKTGNKYIFGHRTNYIHEDECTNGFSVTPYVWRWSLSQVENVHGQVMNYTYQQDTKTIHYTDCQGNPDAIAATTWVYPREIKYSNDRYRILFNRIARTDYETLWASEYSFFMAYQKSLLRSIQVEHDANGDGTFETIVRKYVLYYANPGSTIFPDYQWSAGGYTPTLTMVREYGLGASQALPAYTFIYDDNMHLTIGSNGYGGTTTYTYNDYDHNGTSESPWHETIPYQSWGNNVPDYSAPFWGNPLKYHFVTSAEGWTKVGATSVLTHNAGGGGSISVIGTAQNASGSSALKSFQPGRWYMIVASAKANDAIGAHTVQLGFAYTQGGVNRSVYGTATTLNTSYKTISSGALFLPADATSLIPRIVSTGSNRVNWYYLYPLTTPYRVTAQTLSTGVDSYTYKYDYAGVATNSPALSEAAAGAHPYNNPYTEFRGHSQVTATDPYGKKTITTFNQDDCLSGRASLTQVKNGDALVQEMSVDYTTPEGVQCTEWNTSLVLFDQDPTSPQYGDPYDLLKYRWVRSASETSTLYNSAEVAAGSTTTTYSYNTTYGNLTQTTQSGTGIPTLTTYINYSPNVSGGRWLVGLPSRVYVKNEAGTTLALSMNLYDGANLFNTPPTEGKLTGMRTLVDGTQYAQTSLDYDTFGNITSQTTWTGYGTVSSAPTTGAQTTFICYGGGVPLGETPCGDDGHHTYPLWIKNPLGHITTLNYSDVALYTPNNSYIGYAMGVPAWVTNPNGAATKVSAEYDGFGRLTKLIRPGDSSASPTLGIAYTNTNPFIVTLTQKINDTQNFTLTRTYDGLGRQTRVNTNNGASIVDFTYGYENNARVDKQSMPHTGTASYWTKAQYDSLARPITVTAPDGTVTSYEYDGLETRVTDANTHTTTSVTNILGQTLSVNAPDGPDLAFDYYDIGNLKTATRSGNTVTITYDKAGRKLTMDDPDMGDWTYSYDALGNLKTQTDARGCILTIGYDVLNRPTSKASSGAGCGTQVNTAYTYDAGTNGVGRRTSMTDASGSTAWLYDVRGRLNRETKTITGHSAFVTEFAYNSADLPTSMEYPDGEVVTTNYNSRMMPISVAGNANYVSSMVYDSAGRMTSRSLGNGLTQAFGYYDWNEKVNNIGQGGRLESLVTGSLQNLSYQYDAVGNVKQITNSIAGETSTYAYDELNRLTSWQLNQNPVEEYKYDAAGNLYEKGGLNIAYGDVNHVHAATSAGGNTYQYDQNGNMTTRIIGGQTVQLGYDAENRLVSVTGTNLSAQFTYNGDGQRVKSIVNGETIYFAGGHFELNDTTSEVTKYYFAGMSRIAVRKYIVPQTTTLNYLLGDHLGSTSIVTDAAGALVVETRYKPWGEVRFTTADLTLPTRYTFTGQYSYMDDSATDLGAAGFGLMFYNARWYDPALGRFAQADTIVPGGVQGLDRYAYVGNNPVKYIDPSGHLAGCDPDYQGSCKDYAASLANHARIELKNELIKTYDIAFEGYWTYYQLWLLSQALAEATELVGGVENLKDILRDSIQSDPNATRDKFTFWMVSDDERKKLCGKITSGSPCASASGVIFSPSNFSSTWQNQTRTPPWARGNLDLMIMKTILHEIGHHILRARPDILWDYRSDPLVANKMAFAAQDYESLATALAYFALLDGQPYPGYQDQMYFVGNIQWQ